MFFLCRRGIKRNEYVQEIERIDTIVELKNLSHFTFFKKELGCSLMHYLHVDEELAIRRDESQIFFLLIVF